MRKFLVFAILVGLYALTIGPFTTHLRDRPVAVKLGYTPEASILKITAGEYQPLIAESAIVRVLFYFGTLFETNRNALVVTPEFYNMFTTLQTAVKLDPYNMDPYYFVQAIYTWELGRVAEVNNMLEYGMKYRDWDYQLPFYIGFNYAYFLKDYPKAAQYMQKAAELSGFSLYANLAARYFFESGRSDFGIAFLETMEREARDPQVREIYKARREALVGVRTLEDAIEAYRQRTGAAPSKLRQLVTAGILDRIPVDPYGGEYFLDETGKVRSTSKFSSALMQEQNGSPQQPTGSD